MLNTMKSRFSGIKLIFLFVIMTVPLFSQGWNNTVTTSIYDFYFLGMDLFTNRNGNNLIELTWDGNIPHTYYVKYYLLNSSGSVIRSSTIDESQISIVSVNISGANDKVYVVYEIDGIIRAKKSTNAGISWSTYDLNNPDGTGAFNAIDIAFDNNVNKLHVVYNRGGQTYYYSLNLNNQWGENQQVSSYGGGTVPTVSFSQDRVHVSYEEGGVAKSRDKYLTSWQTPETLSSSSLIERIHGGNSKLLYFYAETQPGLYANLYVKQRNLNGSSWSSPTLLMDHTDFYAPFVSTTNTTDGKTHIVYNGPGSTVYRNYNGSTWSSELTIGDNNENPLISSVSNDLFVIWMGTNNYIKYRQYDAAPLTPQNFSVTVYYTQYDSYPKLTWDLNNEPDVRGNDVNGYIIERRLNGGSFDPIDSVDGMTSEYIDYQIHYAGSGPNSAEYRIRANDVNQHASEYTEIGRVRWGNAYKNGTGEGTGIIVYSLSQNYPNPFNPSTEIKYSLAKDSYVTLKIYDMLGKEVAVLVNGNKTAGYYSVEYNGSNLPSGVYIYRLTAGKFSSAKKLMLMK